ncbi:MAG TPA: UbiD family decarboxylase [Xanthobacteraceae bacterium]|nr:UbiD family decarboxylase [Xanthobacteraceae bacterium]
MQESNEQARRLAALGDLRKALELAEEMGELEVIEGADPNLEIGALYHFSLQKKIPPILLFRKIKGYPDDHRIAVNVRSSRLFVDGHGLDRVQALRKQRRKNVQPIPPVMVETGPVMEHVLTGDAVDVLKFPAPKWNEGDGGKYIGTECMVVTQDPDSDWVNAGTYRVQVHDAKTVSIFIEPGKHGDVIRRKYWAKGVACPFAVSVGQAPVLGAAAASTPPENVSEFAAAGARLGRPLELVKGKVTGIPFPADAELVFEGFMAPPEERSVTEGPFGEWPGYYTSTGPAPVLDVKAIYHRNAPIVTGSPPMKPTYPGAYYGIASTSLLRAANLWDELEAAGVPGVTGVWKMPGSGARFMNIISIRQMHPGHAKMAGLVAAGCGSNAYLGRVIIIVDDDIDITDPAEVIWAISTRWDPKTATDIIDGMWTGHIDPMLPPERREAHEMTNSRIIIYAVRPFHWKDEFPKVNAIDKDYAEAVKRKWQGKLKFLDGT